MAGTTVDPSGCQSGHGVDCDIQGTFLHVMYPSHDDYMQMKVHGSHFSMSLRSWILSEFGGCTNAPLNAVRWLHLKEELHK